MLDIKTAKTIKEALDKYFKNGSPIKIEDICRMQPIPTHTHSGGYTILSTQYGDLTILVWVQFDETHGVSILGVKTQSW